MRNIIVVFIVLLFSGLWLSSAGAAIARGGGGARPQVGNRSVGLSQGNIDRGNFNRNVAGAGSVNRSAAAGSVNRSAAAGSVNRNVAGVSRNVNDVNVNRNVNVHGWGNNYWVDDNHWNWGSFATGAAAGATTAAIGAAAAASAAPAMGMVVTTLPPTCANVPGTALYDCAGAYYQPSYEGSNLVYQVVPHP